MSLLFTIVRAAHARGSHHKLALEALRRIEGPGADRWQRLFLKSAHLYLEGSKAPDDEFKDFKNHVLHPRDGYWGGAPQKARDWYANLVEELANRRWETAVYSAGVLSHYVVDPMHPFHTAQSEAENNIHRATEWSISKSFDELLKLGTAVTPDVRVEAADDPNWLAMLVCAGADRANKQYEKLIAHYDIHRGVSDPPAGLDGIARRLVGELIVHASAALATVLEKAFSEAKATPPEVELTAATLVAALQIPKKWLAKRIADGAERRQIERMYDELKATGTVEANLPADDRAVRDAHGREVASKRVAPDVGKLFPLEPRTRTTAQVDCDRQPAADMSSHGREPRVAAAAPPEPAPNRLAPPIGVLQASFPPELDDEAADAQDHPEEAIVTLVPAPSRAGPGRDSYTYLTADHEIVDAPSIGPKTAERLEAAGVDTVGDLLKSHPIALAARLDQRHITAETITDWQDQARLVCDVPGLRGTHAQLLVGAGYRTRDALAAADAPKLCADVLAFAMSPAGQRLLRDGNPPDIERIKSWLESARSVKAA